MKLRNVTETTVLPAGTMLRVLVVQDGLESGLNVQLALLLTSWRNLLTRWLDLLPGENVGLIPNGTRSWSGTGLLFNQSLAFDARVSRSQTAGQLLTALEKSLPLGADVGTIDPGPTMTPGEQTEKASKLFAFTTPDADGVLDGVTRTVQVISSVAIIGAIAVGGFFILKAVKEFKPRG